MDRFLFTIWKSSYLLDLGGFVDGKRFERGQFQERELLCHQHMLQ